MSSTRSALRGTPRAKPNDMIASVAPVSWIANRARNSCCERVRAAVGGVDQMIGGAAQRAEQLALLRDAVLGGAIERERVAAARLGEAADELGALAFEEQQRDVVAMLAQPRQSRDDALRIEAAGTRIDHDRERTVLALGARRAGASRKRSSSISGRLSTTSQPRSSSVRTAVLLPAPDMPVTSSRRRGPASLLMPEGRRAAARS